MGQLPVQHGDEAALRVDDEVSVAEVRRLYQVEVMCQRVFVQLASNCCELVPVYSIIPTVPMPEDGYLCMYANPVFAQLPLAELDVL